MRERGGEKVVSGNIFNFQLCVVKWEEANETRSEDICVLTLRRVSISSPRV